MVTFRNNNNARRNNFRRNDRNFKSNGDRAKFLPFSIRLKITIISSKVISSVIIISKCYHDLKFLNFCTNYTAIVISKIFSYTIYIKAFFI